MNPLSFNPFSALTSKIYGGLSIVLILVIASLLVFKNHEISRLTDSVENPKTGYKAQLASANQFLGVCHANNVTLTNALADQNASVDRLAAATRAQAAQSAAQLALIRSSDASSLAVVRQAIANAPRTANSCQNAKAILNAVIAKGTVK